MVRFLSATGRKKRKFMNTYQVPVWLTMATVIVLKPILWWGLANWRHNPLKDSRTFQTLSYSLYNVWDVAISISATNTPNTWKCRFLFLVYVYYCFAVSTVL